MYWLRGRCALRVVWFLGLHVVIGGESPQRGILLELELELELEPEEVYVYTYACVCIYMYIYHKVWISP